MREEECVILEIKIFFWLVGKGEGSTIRGTNLMQS